MSAYFFDSSSLVKNYVEEAGSDQVAKIITPESGNTIFLSGITRVECMAAFAKRQRLGDINQKQRKALEDQFLYDLENENLYIIELTQQIAESCMHLPAAHSLRAYDAIQLGTALFLHSLRQQREMSNLIFTCSDSQLVAAAMGAGVTVHMPT